PHVALLVLEGAGHAVGDDLGIRPHIGGPRQHLHRLGAIGVVVLVQPVGGTDQRLHHANMGVGVFIGPFSGDAKDFLGIVLPDLVVGDHRHADTLEHRLLVPGLAPAIAVNGAGFHGGGHL